MLQCLEATETYMKGVLSFTDEELVSADFIHNVPLERAGCFPGVDLPEVTSGVTS